MKKCKSMNIFSFSPRPEARCTSFAALGRLLAEVTSRNFSVGLGKAMSLFAVIV